MLTDELADLAVFTAVAEARSFTRAAARLGRSQSALSQTVRRLDERLQLRLLTRTTQRRSHPGRGAAARDPAARAGRH